MENLTKDQLTNLFYIYPENGKVFWKNVSKHHKRLNGIEAGCAQNSKNKDYWVIKINNKKYKRGRLIFFYVYGKLPKPCIDHINGNSLDDRIENLREATVIENAWNHKKRKRKINLPMGVRNTPNGKFQARISYYGKQLHLGVFDTSIEAENVYKLKRKELYGKFA